MGRFSYFRAIFQKHSADDWASPAKRTRLDSTEPFEPSEPSVSSVHLGLPVLDRIAQALVSDHRLIGAALSLACVSKAASESVDRAYRELSPHAAADAKAVVLRELVAPHMAELRTSNQELCLYADCTSVTAVQLGKSREFSGQLVALQVLENGPLSVTVLCADTRSVNRTMWDYIGRLRAVVQHGSALMATLGPRAMERLQVMLPMPKLVVQADKCQVQLAAFVILKYTRRPMLRLALGERVPHCLALPVLDKLERQAAKSELV